MKISKLQMSKMMINKIMKKGKHKSSKYFNNYKKEMTNMKKTQCLVIG